MTKNFTNKKLVSLLAVLALSGTITTLTSYSTGPPGGYTNAPGESNCTSCHSGTLQTSGGTHGNITLVQNTPYGSGTSTSPYSFTLSYYSPGIQVVGFQAAVLPTSASSSSNSLGTLVAPSSSGTQVVSGSGRHYIEHNSSGTAANSSGQKSWTFNWIPPSSAYQGNVSFYVVINASDNSSDNSGDTIYAKVFTIGVLPVKWNNFSAKLESHKAKLSWSTTQEINSNRFEIERSYNEEDWEPIGQIKAAGNSNALHHYAFTDESNFPFQQAFYRIRQFDTDNKQETSNIVHLTTEKLNDISVNLVTDRREILVEAPAGIQTLSLFDLDGRLLKQIEGNGNKMLLSTQGLPCGICLVRVATSEGIQTRKLLLSN